MSHNKLSYCVSLVSEQPKRRDEKIIGLLSTDGVWIAGNSDEITRFDDTPKPDYVGAEEFPNWPSHLTHEEVRDITSREASTLGASNGWRFRRTV